MLNGWQPLSLFLLQSLADGYWRGSSGSLVLRRMPRLPPVVALAHNLADHRCWLMSIMRESTGGP